MSQLATQLGIDEKTQKRIQSEWSEYFHAIGIADGDTRKVMQDLMLERRDVPQRFLPPGRVLVGFGPPANDWRILNCAPGEELELLRRSRDPLDADEAREWIDNRLHQWVREIQDRIGVISGDNAAMFFDAPPDRWAGLLTTFAEYADYELRYVEEEEEIDPGEPNFGAPWPEAADGDGARRVMGWASVNLPFDAQIDQGDVILWRVNRGQDLNRSFGLVLHDASGEAPVRVIIYRDLPDGTDEQIGIATSWRQLYNLLAGQ